MDENKRCLAHLVREVGQTFGFEYDLGDRSGQARIRSSLGSTRTISYNKCLKVQVSTLGCHQGIRVHSRHCFVNRRYGETFRSYHHHLRTRFDLLETVVVPLKVGKRSVSFATLNIYYVPVEAKNRKTDQHRSVCSRRTVGKRREPRYLRGS